MTESTVYVPPSTPTPPRGEREPFTGNDEPKPGRRRPDKPAPDSDPEESEPDSDPNDPGPVPPGESDSE